MKYGVLLVGAAFACAIVRAQSASSAQQSANGSQAASPYTLRADSQLVILDVVVSDAQGHAVRGIGRQHFQVTEQKEPQTLLNFEEGSAHLPPPTLNIHSTAELDKQAPDAPVNVIVLDEFNMRFEDEAFARYSLKKYLEKDSGKLALPTMLVAVDLRHFTVLHDYTQDRREILSSLDHHLADYPWQAEQGNWIPERFSQAFLTLRRVSEATQGHVGHKNMIWIGRGFPTIDLGENNPEAAALVKQLARDCVNQMQEARVTLYTIDPVGVAVTNKYSDDDSDDPLGGNYQFSQIAIATGGKALYGRSDVDTEISTAIADAGSFYTLSYRPKKKLEDTSQLRRIKVMVDVPGLSVATHEGYYVKSPPSKVDASHLTRDLTVDMMLAETSQMPYDGVPVTVVPHSDDPDSFTLHLPVSGVTWIAATDTAPAYAEVMVMTMTFDKRNNPLHRNAQVLRVKRRGTPDSPASGAIDLPWRIDHEPQAVRVRFVVRMAPQGRIGTADVGANGLLLPPTGHAAH